MLSGNKRKIPNSQQSRVICTGNLGVLGGPEVAVSCSPSPALLPLRFPKRGPEQCRGGFVWTSPRALSESSDSSGWSP